MPTSFLTKTFLFTFSFILDDKTKVTIIGKPSGTATIIIVTARVKACSKWSKIKAGSWIKDKIFGISKLLAIKIVEKR